MARTAAGTRTAIPTKQNLLTYSEQFDNAAWVKVYTSVAADVDFPAGFGFTGAFQLKEDGTAGVTHELRTGTIQPTSGLVTFSGFFKKSASNFIRIAGNGGASTLIVNLNTGVVTPAGVSVSSGITAIGDGWYRVWLTYLATSAYPWCSVYLTSDGTTLVYDGTLGRINTLAIGLQLVSANWPGPYVQTVASAVNTGNIRSLAQPVTPVNKLVDGDMEAAGTANYPSSNATISKQTISPHSGSQLLRVAFNGTNTIGWTAQTILTVGKNYRMQGWARSDGTSVPRAMLGGSTYNWIGTTDTAWQRFDFTFVADGTSCLLRSENLSAGHYVEFDDIQVIDLAATPMRLVAGTRLTA